MSQPQSEFRVLLGFHHLVEHISVLRLSQQMGESLGWFRVTRLRGTEGHLSVPHRKRQGTWARCPRGGAETTGRLGGIFFVEVLRTSDSKIEVKSI